MRTTTFLAAVVTALMTGSFATAADATPVTYDVTLTSSTGPSGTGAFTIDGPVPSSGNAVYMTSDASLTALNLAFGGITFDAPSYVQIFFQNGNFVSLTYQGYDTTDTYYLNSGGGGYNLSGGNVFATGTVGVSAAPPVSTGGVPEPLTLALVSAGLAGMGAMRRRKAA